MGIFADMDFIDLFINITDYFAEAHTRILEQYCIMLRNFDIPTEGVFWVDNRIVLKSW